MLYGGENIPRTPIDESSGVYFFDINTNNWDIVSNNNSPPIRIAQG
jgi:hypothetical protein